MRRQSQSENITTLFIHVPKLSNYYKPLDEFMFINFIPMGVFAMCDLLNKKGFSSRILHMGIEYINDHNFSIANYISDKKVTIAALSLHWHYQSFDVIDVVKKIKHTNPEVVTVLGGYTASIFAEEIIANYDCVDCVIVGDGEKGIADLTRVVNDQNPDWSGIANAVYRKNSTTINNGISYTCDCSTMSDTDYANMKHLVNYQCYIDYFKMPYFWLLRASVKRNLKRHLNGAHSMFPLMIGRGCNFNCSYCGGGRLTQRTLCNRAKPVFMPVEKVVNTMEQALRFGYDSFISSFDPFPDDGTYFLDLFKEIRQRNISCGIGFESWGIPSKELILSLSKTCIHKKSYVAISPESGSEEVRKQNKSCFYSNEQLFNILEIINREKIPILIFLTVGLPGDNSERIKESVMFSRTIQRRFNYAKVLTVPIQLEPGSPLYTQPEKYDAITNRHCFEDFYNYHGQPDSGPYTYLGYALKSVTKTSGDIDEFNNFIKKQRCRHFCIIQFKLFGKIPVPIISRLICSIMHRRWEKMGFGKPCEKRRRYK